MPKYALRGLGPKTFISYSFRDAALAIQLRDHLVGAGLQVTMEDETSLLNERLPDVLPLRIAETECFIQLRTQTSNASYWVARELDLAIARHAEDENFVLIPVVVDHTNLSDQVRQWVYVDATRDGLSRPVLDLIVATALKSIVTASVDVAMPTMLEQASVDALWEAHRSNRRILIDPTGFWLVRLDEVASWLERDSDASYQGLPQSISNVQDIRMRIEHTLELADSALNYLAREVCSHLDKGTVEQPAARAITNTFYRLLFQDAFVDVLKAVDRAGLFEMGNDARKDFAVLTSGDPSNPDHRVPWALQPLLSITFGERALVETEFGGENVDTARVYFPRFLLVQPDAIMSMPAPPRAHIDGHDWVQFGLPQVAARAVSSALPLLPHRRQAAMERIGQCTGWSLDRYSTIGRP